MGGLLAAGFMSLSLMAGNVYAQDVLSTPVWNIPVDQNTWFTNDNNSRGVAYNKATGNLIIFSRTGGLKPVILDAATGDSVGVMSVAGIAGGTFPASLIDVSPDGRIFATNLTTNATTGDFKIYSWANESADPKLIYSGSVNGTALRFGDSFRADFTDGASMLLAGGSGNPNLAVFTYDAASDTVSAVNVFAFDPAVMRAVRGISPIAGEDSLWVNEFDFNLRKISLSTGQFGTVVPESVFPTKEALWVEHANANGRELAAVFPSSLGAAGQSASIIDLATGTEIAFTAASATGNANGNGAGGAIFDIENGLMYLLATNNRIAAYDISEYIPVPVTISDFNLLSPANGASLSLGADPETEVNISWEAAPSTVAWARNAFNYEFDSFAHGGGGANGTGGYIGSRLGVAATVTLPVLESPKTISMWAATYSNATVLKVDIEKSSDNTDWTVVQTLDAVAGGTGDINVSWQQVSADLDATGTTFVRLRVHGDNIAGAAYFDDVRVTNAAGSVLLDESFDAWGSFKEVTYTWHLDAVTGSFDPPALSISAGNATSLALTIGDVLAAAIDLELPEGIFNGAWTVTAEFEDEVKFANQIWTIDLDVPVGTSVEGIENPFSFELAQNFPNPFNPSTQIVYSIAEVGHVEISVYTVTGQRVATLVNETMSAGRHSVSFDASQLSSGVYIYRLTSGGFTSSQKMVLVK